MSDQAALGMAGDTRVLVSSAWRLSPRGMILQIALLVANGLVSGVSLLLLIPIINSVADSHTTVSVPIVGDVSLAGIPLWALLTAFVALIAVQALISQWSSVTSTRIQQVLVDSLRQEAFAAVLASRWTFLLSRRRSDIITVVSVGAARAGLAYNQLLQLSVAAVFAIVTAIIALVVSPAVAAIAIVGVMVMGVVQALAIRPAHRMGVELGQRQRALQSVITDSLDSLRLVRAHSASDVWNARLAEAFASTREVQVANVRRQSAVSGLTSVGTAIAASLLVLVSVALDVPAASIAVILLLVFRLALNVRQVVSSATQMANSLPAVGDLVALTRDARAEAEVDAGATSDRGTLSTDPALALLELDGVTYAYPGSENGVCDLTFRVARGDITALVGTSGAGKSTTVDLVLGLLAAQSGVIRIDGRPMRPQDLAWWRGHVAYVPQETVLIPGTLRDNLTWSVPGGAADDACWQALDQAAAAFARALPDGLDTVLGDRGIRLSGGERQRVAIARALLRRPALLVLDEATSSLDDETEGEVLDLLATLTPAVTVLVIAHRRSTIEAAHHWVRIDHGTVVATSDDDPAIP